MLKIVDIGVYAAAPDYGELIKVYSSFIIDPGVGCIEIHAEQVDRSKC